MASIFSQPAHAGLAGGGEFRTQGLASLHPALLSGHPLSAGAPPSCLCSTSAKRLNIHTAWGLDAAGGHTPGHVPRGTSNRGQRLNIKGARQSFVSK